jgi:CRP/FNR family cyclic AMP-dependent transcriptional regulator
VEHSILLEVTRADLLQLLGAEEQVAEALLRSLGAIVRRTTRPLTDRAFLNLQGRVARQLLLLADAGGQGTRTPRVTQGELAAMVGAVRQTVNQELKSLEALGYIRVAGRAVEILDRVELQRLADG